MRRILRWAILLGLGAVPAAATPYWVSWEGEGDTAGLPEEFGWSRNWGNWNGQYQGPGAYRTLENGILTYDSLYDPGVFDFSNIHYPDWPMDPAPGEQFVMEWRLKVAQVVGSYDPGVALAADTWWMVGFQYSENWVRSAFEDGVYIPITAGVFHEYRLLSSDMLSYEFYIDGQLARVGSFWESATQSYVGWGDGVQGAASLHSWDYFRFGVIPEPTSAVVGVAVVVCGGSRRWRSSFGAR